MSVRKVRGFTLVEQLVALAIAAVVLVVVWRAYLSVTRQDEGTRLLADRLQTTALAQAELQRDLEARCRLTGARIEGDGQVLVLPPHPAPSGPADGPQGAGELRWELARDGSLSRNGRAVGLPVVSAARFTVLQEAEVATLKLKLTWRQLAGQKGEPPVSQIAHSWRLPRPEPAP